MIRLRRIWEGLRESFWFLPAVLTVLAMGLAVGLLALDRRGVGRAFTATAWLYVGGAEGARSLLSAIAGSLVTVIALAFSITIVSLQLASAQLGPRLLRSFVRDRGNQVVLGAFVATFVYCILVLRTVRGQDGLAEGDFVPHLAITGAIALTLLSVALLIYFLHHASRAIQADRVIAAVAADLHATIDTLFPEADEDEAAVPEPMAALPGALAPITGAANGYVLGIDEEAVLRAAGRHDVRVHLARRPGDFVIAGEPVAWAAPAARLDARLADAVTDAVVVGAERTLLQDPRFGIEQLVEIAVRALASGYADPTTALRCIDRLGAALAHAAGRRLPGVYGLDGAGVRRLVRQPLTLGELVATAFAPIRLQGAGNRAVALRLLVTFERLALLRRRRDLRAALLAEAVRVQRAAAPALGDPDDRLLVRDAFDRVLAALAVGPRGAAGDRASAA